MLEFPIKLNKESTEINLNEDIKIKSIKNIDRERLFGITDYTTDGKTHSFSRTRPSELYRGQLDEIYLIGTNYLLITKTIEEAQDVVYAFKLLINNNSAISIGFEGNHPAYYINNPSSFGDEPLHINETNAGQIINLIQAIEKNKNNDKLKIIKEIYLFSFSEILRIETRFLEIAFALEMILIPEKGADVSLRFCLRFAKLLNGYNGKSIEDLFKIGKEIYNTRSDLAHSGRSKSLEKTFPHLNTYGREIIQQYTLNPDTFTEKNLFSISIN